MGFFFFGENGEMGFSTRQRGIACKSIQWETDFGNAE